MTDTAREVAERIVSEAVAEYGAVAFRDFDCDLIPQLTDKITLALAAAVAPYEQMLSDPAAVRVNILCGTIKVPDDLVWLHDTNGPVAAALAAAVAGETDRCAKVAKGYVMESLDEWHRGYSCAATRIAAAIRSPETAQAGEEGR